MIVWKSRPWLWMSNSADAKVRFLWERIRATTRADYSDAGMTCFLLTGDETSNPAKLKSFLDDKIIPPRLAPRARIRLEAERFHVSLQDGRRAVIDVSAN